MEWYYAIGKQQIGPVSDDEFRDLVANGTITSNTLVWNRTMSGWTEYGQIAGQNQAASAGAPQATGTRLLHCSECGRPFPENELINYNNVMVCAACKPVFVQKIKEGVGIGVAMEFAGFWIRVGAAIIDWLALYAIIMIITIPFEFFIATMGPDVGEGGNLDGFNMSLWMGMNILMALIQFGIGVAYETWFVGKFAATPGKMACKIKVVNADGSKVSYLKALGRYFAKMLSSLILFIGYIMVAFDSEKRGLHDHICNTRVIRK
jgi:uncharacterized RDD family membrane protein YckC